MTNPFIPVTTLRLGLQPERCRQAVDLTQGTVRLQGGTGTTNLPKRVRRKYVQSRNLTIQPELPASFLFQAGYAATRATGQMALVALTAGPRGAGTPGRALFSRFGLTAGINCGTL